MPSVHHGTLASTATIAQIDTLPKRQTHSSTAICVVAHLAEAHRARPLSRTESYLRDETTVPSHGVGLPDEIATQSSQSARARMASVGRSLRHTDLVSL